MSKGPIIDSVINIYICSDGYLIDGTIGYRLQSVHVTTGKNIGMRSPSKKIEKLTKLDVPINVIGQEIINIEQADSSFIFVIAGGSRIIISNYGITML